MKRIPAVLALALTLSGPAAADTLAQQVQTEASRLLTQVKAAEAAARARPSAAAPSLAPELASDLQRFGLAASRLSGEIDKSGGPTDLRCIFRGMAEETGKQLQAATAAKTAAEQSIALSHLTHMLSDAILIAPAVGGGPAQTKAAVNATSTAAKQCPVERNF
ncbi:MAG: hypothetical protein R3C46_12540 [Hyphomonadaceae bacterium]